MSNPEPATIAPPDPVETVVGPGIGMIRQAKNVAVQISTEHKVYTIFEDGTISGFPDGSIVVNRIPALIWTANRTLQEVRFDAVVRRIRMIHIVNPISLGGWGLLLLCAGLDLRFRCFSFNGYILLGVIAVCSLVIFVPMVKDLRKQARDSHEAGDDV